MAIHTDETISTQDLTVLLNDARSGVGHAAAEIHREYVDKLVVLASRRINQRFRSKISPEEVVQSVFASFFRRNNDESYLLEDWNELWALLVKITINKCVGKVASFGAAKRDIRREVADNGSEAGAAAFLVSAGDPTPQEIAIFNETIDELFDRIPEFSKQIVSLRLLGMSNFEISESLDCSERTVYRALKRIREIFWNLDIV